MSESEVTQAVIVKREQPIGGETPSPLEKLHPEKYVDQEGAERVIYTFQTKEGSAVRAVFYAPEEIPFAQKVVDGKQGFIFGREPRLRPKEDWGNFIVNVRDSSVQQLSPVRPLPGFFNETIQKGNALIFVENDPTGILDLAFTLGIEDPNLRTDRQEANQRRLTETATDMIDGVIAGNIINEAREISPSNNYEGEALTVLALQGDNEAKRILEEKKKALEENDKVKHDDYMQQLREITQNNQCEPLKLKDLVAVHLTRYLPKRNGDHLGMQSTFDGTDWQLPRVSVHWALNHPVAAHMYGRWDAQPYAVISPLNGLIEQNGKPEVLNTVDTFFEVPPGTSLDLPEGTVIVKPGKVEEGKTFSKAEDGTIHYKTGEYSKDNIQEIMAQFTEYGRSFFSEQIIRQMTLDGLQIYGNYSDSFITEEEHTHLVDVVGGREKGEWQFKRDITKEFGDEPVIETVKRLYKEGEVGGKIPEELILKIASNIQTKFTDQVKRSAIYEQMRLMGFEAHAGGMWAWGDSWEVTDQTQKLGLELDSPVTAHTDHISTRVEQVLVGGMGAGPGLLNLVRAGEITPYEYKDQARRYLEEYIPDVSQESRRMLYLMGVI